MPVFELMDIAAIVLAELVRKSNLEEGTADPLQLFCVFILSRFFKDISSESNCLYLPIWIP